MLIPSVAALVLYSVTSLSRRVNANSQRKTQLPAQQNKLIKKGEC